MVVMSIFSQLCIFAAATSQSLAPQPPPSIQEEKVALERLAAIWQEKNDPIIVPVIQKEIDNFLASYPKSCCINEVLMMQGDLYLLRKDYNTALNIYDKIQNSNAALAKRKLFAFVSLKEWEQALHEVSVLEEHNPTIVASVKKGEKIFSAHAIAETLFQSALQQEQEIACTQLCQRAEQYLLALLFQTPDQTLLNKLAIITQKLNRPEIAIQAALDVSKKDPEKKNQYLLFAAKISKKTDPKFAQKILQRVEVDNAHSSLAKANLLFQIRDYESLIAQRQQLKQYLSTKEQLEIELLIAEAATASNNLFVAQEAFENAIQKSQQNPALSEKNRENIQLLALSFYSEHNMWNKASETANKILDQFPNSSEANLVQLHLAKALQRQNRSELAKQITDIVCSQAQDEKIESLALLTQAEMLLQQKKPEEAQQKILSALSIHPESPNRRQALLLQIAALLQQIEAKPIPEDPEDIAHLRDALVTTFVDEKVEFSDQDKIQIVYQTAHRLYQKQRIRAADSLLHLPPATISDSTQKADWLLLQAACDAKGFEDWQGFIQHATEAIHLSIAKQQKCQIRAALASAFRKVANQEDNPTTRAIHLAKAKEHLEIALQLQDLPCVPTEDLLWFTKESAYSIGLTEDPTACLPSHPDQEKVEKVHDLLCGVINDPTLSDQEKELPYLLSYRMLDALGKTKEKKKVLHLLLKGYQNQNEWEYEQNTWYLKAKELLQNNLLDKAQIAFEKSQQKGFNPRIAKASQMEIAKILYQKTPVHERSAQHPNCKKSLSLLNQLSSDRTVATEPIHLEATIEYARLLSSLSTKESRAQSLIENLQIAKQRLLSNETIIDCQYHDKLKNDSEKERLFQGHLLLIDALAALAKAEICLAQGEEQKAERAARSAFVLYESLQVSNMAITPFLQQECSSGLHRSDVTLHTVR